MNQPNEPQFFTTPKPKTLNTATLKALSFVAAAVLALIALQTFSSNWDYFRQFFHDFALIKKAVPFVAIEVFVVSTAFFIGWGNRRQIHVAAVFDVVIIVLLAIHTSLVGDYVQTKLQAEKQKADATTDVTSEKQRVAEVSKRNETARNQYNEAKRLYNQSLASYQNRAYIARLEGRAAPKEPKEPTEPTYEKVPSVSDDLVARSTQSADAVAETKVPHGVLYRLLQSMLVVMSIGVVTLLKLSHRFKLKMWHERGRDHFVKEQTKVAPIVIRPLDQNASQFTNLQSTAVIPMTTVAGFGGTIQNARPNVGTNYSTQAQQSTTPGKAPGRLS